MYVWKELLMVDGVIIVPRHYSQQCLCELCTTTGWSLGWSLAMYDVYYIAPTIHICSS
jgi:hypothetical protein